MIQGGVGFCGLLYIEWAAANDSRRTQCHRIESVTVGCKPGEGGDKAINVAYLNRLSGVIFTNQFINSARDATYDRHTAAGHGFEQSQRQSFETRSENNDVGLLK